MSNVESLFLMNFKHSEEGMDPRMPQLLAVGKDPGPMGRARQRCLGVGRAPTGKGGGVMEKCGLTVLGLTVLPKAGAAWDWGVWNVLFSQTHSLRLNLRCVSEVEFDPCRQLIWTFLAWIICLTVSPDQINWIIAKPLLSCAPLGSWCSQQDGVGLQGQASLEN